MRESFTIPVLSLNPNSLTAYLHRQIPATAALGIQVTHVEPDAVKLHAPLAPNLNHQATAFGGSLSTLGITAGWTLMHVRLMSHRPRVEVVIQDSQTRFMRPADAGFDAVCRLRVSDGWDNFALQLSRRGKARIGLRAELTCAGNVIAVHDGLYVAREA